MSLEIPLRIFAHVLINTDRKEREIPLTTMLFRSG